MCTRRLHLFWTILISMFFITSVLNGTDVHANFRNVTSTAGVGQEGLSYGNPVWGDFNNDGYLDLIVPRHWSTASIYQNNGTGQFSDIFSLSGITNSKLIDRHGWAWGDYNNDGNLDLHITVAGCRGNCLGSKKDELWEGNGLGVFTNVVSIGGVENALGRGRNNFWIDYNNDGFLDLFVLNYRTNSILYRNNGNGTFTDVTAETGLVNISGEVCSWADYNKDGTMDLLVTGDKGIDRLFKNQPLLNTFTDITLQAGLLPLTGTGIAWGDYNNDGYMDLYISRGREILRNSLLWNSTKITFGDEERLDDGLDFMTSGSNVTFDLYIENKRLSTKVFLGVVKNNPLSIPFTVSITDPLLNGIPTYIAGTDMGIFIWRDASDIWHVRYSGTAKYPTYYGILTSDGSFTMVSPTFKPAKFNFTDTLYRNNGDGTFTGVTDLAGVGKMGNHQTAVWGDYNNDGFLDLYVVENGDVSGGKPNILYKNNRNGTFTDVAANQGVDSATIPGRKYGAAWGDYNNDGFLDLFVKNGLRIPYPYSMGSDILYRNNGNTKHWLKINIVGTVSNRLGIGAKLTLVTNGKMQYREVNGGGGGELRSQGNGPVHFGLGRVTSIDTLIIKWPSGIIQTLTNILADQTITVTEN